MEKSIEKQNLSKIAVKGSAYNIISMIILKFGGLLFTIILARMLLPELFGIYSLVLSIATLAVAFIDLGMENTFLRYLSESVGKNDNKRSRGFASYFFKKRLILVILVILILVAISKHLSYNIYNQPLLFYPLIFSCLFIIAESFRVLLAMFFVAKKEMRSIVFFDASSQIMKILFSVFAILMLSDKMKISGIFFAFFISSFFTLLLEFFILKKKDKEILFGERVLSNKSQVNSYWKYMVLATLSLSVFNLIDILMMGGFVSSEYLAYYRAALSIVTAIASLFSLSSIFLPIFTQINNKRFERGFQKTFRYLLILSLPATIGLIFISKHLIKAVYGDAYLLGASVLYFLSILIITTPLIGLYSTILQSKEKSRIIGNSIFFSLILNIILNFVAIKLFIDNPLQVIIGVSISTALSRIVLLGILMFYASKHMKLNYPRLSLRNSIFATLIMSVFLLLFNKLVNMNLFFGIIEIIGAILIYFGILIFIREITKEDLKIIKDLLKK